jgi:hypothetical protein
MDKFSFFNRRKGYFLAEEIDSVIIPFADLNISDSAISRGFYMHNDEIHAIFSGYSQESNILNLAEAGNIQTISHDSKVSQQWFFTNCFSPDGLTVYSFMFNGIIQERKLNTAFTYSDGFTTSSYAILNETQSNTIQISDDGFTLFLADNSPNGLVKIKMNNSFDLNSVFSEEFLPDEYINNAFVLFGKDKDNNNRYISQNSVFVEKNGTILKTHEIKTIGKRLDTAISVANNHMYQVNRNNFDDEVELYKYTITYKS